MVRLLLSFFIVLDLSIGTASFAQLRLSGKVVDESGSPVAFANVLAISSDSSFVAGDVTGEDGRYSIWLDKKKASFVRISFLGYDDILRPAGKDAGFTDARRTEVARYCHCGGVKHTRPALQVF